MANPTFCSTNASSPPSLGTLGRSYRFSCEALHLASSLSQLMQEYYRPERVDDLCHFVGEAHWPRCALAHCSDFQIPIWGCITTRRPPKAVLEEGKYSKSNEIHTHLGFLQVTPMASHVSKWHLIVWSEAVCTHGHHGNFPGCTCSVYFWGDTVTHTHTARWASAPQLKSPHPGSRRWRPQ